MRLGDLLYSFEIMCNVLYLSKIFYSPTESQLNCLKNMFSIYIKIGIKTAPTCFGAVTPSSGNAILMLAKITVFKVALASTRNVLPDDGVTAPKHVEAVLMSILM